MNINSNKKWFIFRHFNSFRKFYCKNLEEAKLLLFAHRRRDFYYYSFVAERNTKAEAKEYIKFNKGAGWKKLGVEDEI